MIFYSLADLTWPEVVELAKSMTVALMPTGATEAHGIGQREFKLKFPLLGER